MKASFDFVNIITFDTSGTLQSNGAAHSATPHS